jgi:hypothetical protein
VATILVNANLRDAIPGDTLTGSEVKDHDGTDRGFEDLLEVLAG